MATTTKKAAPKKRNVAQPKTGAGPAVAERSKDAKKTFGKAAPKKVPSAAASKPAKATKAKAASGKPSMATRVMRKFKNTASGAVAMAASVVGKGSKPAKAKGK